MFQSRINLTISDNKIVTIKTNFGYGFEKYIKDRLLSYQRAKALFISISMYEISFYEFFSLEVYHILNTTLEKAAPSVMLNRVNIKETIKQISKDTWIRDMNTSFGYQYDNKIITKLFVYDMLKEQEPWFREYSDVKQKAHYRGYLLEGEPGSGKTFMSLAMAELEESDIVVVISPSNAVQNVWVKSLISGEPYKKKQEYYVINKDNKYKNERFVISSYESLKDLLLMFNEFKRPKITVIIDEIHNMNEKESLRTNLVIDFVNALEPHNVILLSGTPIKVKPSEMLTMIALIDTHFTPAVRKRFEVLYKGLPDVLKPALQERYQGYRVKVTQKKRDRTTTSINFKIKIPNAQEYTLKSVRLKIKKYVEERMRFIEEHKVQYEHTYTTLYEKAKNIMLTANDDLTPFTAYEEQVRHIRLMYEQGRLMEIGNVIRASNMFEKLLLAELHGEEKQLFKEAKTIYKYPMLGVRGEVLGVVVTRERIRCHADMAKAVKYTTVMDNTLKKTVIFTNYVDVADAAFNTLRSQGYDPIGVYGKQTINLNKNVSLFVNPDNKINPLVTTYDSMSQSVPLVVANSMLFFDLPFRSYRLTQTMRRIDRNDQDSDITYYYAVLDTGKEPNLNSRNIDIIKWSAEMVSDITGNDIDVVIASDENEEIENIGLESYDMIKEKTYTNFLNW